MAASVLARHSVFAKSATKLGTDGQTFHEIISKHHNDKTYPLLKLCLVSRIVPIQMKTTTKATQIEHAERVEWLY